MSPEEDRIVSLLVGWTYPIVTLAILFGVLFMLDWWLKKKVDDSVKQQVGLFKELNDLKYNQLKDGNSSAVSKLNTEINCLQVKLEGFGKENERLKGDSLSWALQLQQLVGEKNTLSRELTKLDIDMRDMTNQMSNLRDSNTTLRNTCENDKLTIARLEITISELTRKYEELKFRQEHATHRQFREERHTQIIHQRHAGSPKSINGVAKAFSQLLNAAKQQDTADDVFALTTNPTAAVTDADDSSGSDIEHTDANTSRE